MNEAMDEPVDDQSDDERDEHDDGSDTLYLKYCFEGASTLAELASALRALAEDLERRAATGWRLGGPVDGGWAHVVQG